LLAAGAEEGGSMCRLLRLRAGDGEEEVRLSGLLDVRRGKASPEVARALELRTGEPIVLLRRVLDFSGQPVLLDEISLPAGLFKGLTKAKLDAYHGSMYGFFESQYGVRMIRAEERITAVAADATTAEILRVRVNSPLLAVDRVAFTYDNRPVEWRRGLCSTRGHCYVNELG